MSATDIPCQHDRVDRIYAADSDEQCPMCLAKRIEILEKDLTTERKRFHDTADEVIRLSREREREHEAILTALREEAAHWKRMGDMATGFAFLQFADRESQRIKEGK